MLSDLQAELSETVEWAQTSWPKTPEVKLGIAQGVKALGSYDCDQMQAALDELNEIKLPD